MSQPGVGEALPAYVLDASALLALLHGESGADVVEPLLRESVVSSVNWSEVFQRALSWGAETQGLREDFEFLGLRVLPFTTDDAESTARLWSSARNFGLSLGDRACLSLAQALNLPAVTADRRWAGLRVGIQIQMIR